MSADNWANCPRCFARAKLESEARFQQAVDAYGKVPPDEYEALREAAQVSVDPDSFNTFREDYEFYGAFEGTVIASYGGGCDVCGLSVSFRHEQKFYDPAEDALS